MTSVTPHLFDVSRHLPATDFVQPARPLCASADPQLFFPEEEIPIRVKEQQIEDAKALCAQCPLNRSCLDGAIARNERWGIWGGMTTGERDDHVKKARPLAATFYVQAA